MAITIKITEDTKQWVAAMSTKELRFEKAKYGTIQYASEYYDFICADLKRRENQMEAKVEDNTLIVKMPLGKGERSKSGKSLIVFTTGGFVTAEGTNMQISINVIKLKSKANINRRLMQ
jgi:hypothetical protein